MISVHTHPESQLTGSTLESMIKQAVSLGRTHFSYTDLGHLSSCLKAYGMAKKAGLKFAPGIEFYFKDNSCDAVVGTPADRCRYFTATLFCTTQASYQELCKLVSRTDLPKTTIQDEIQSLWSWSDLELMSKLDTLLVFGGVHCMVGKAFVSDGQEVAEKVLLRAKNLFGSRLSLALVCEPWDKKYASVVKITYTDGTHDSLLGSDTVSTDKARKIKAIDLINRGGHNHIKSKVAGYMHYHVDKRVEKVTEHKGFLPLPGGDVTLNINNFFLRMSEKHDIQLLVSDYAFYAEKSDHIVQTMVLEGKNKLKSDLHMKSQEEFLNYLQKNLKLGLTPATKILMNNEEWAKNFDNLELKYEWRLAESGGNALQQCMQIIKDRGRMDWKNPTYTARLREEIEVIAKNPMKDLTAYFLPIRDVLNHYLENGQLTGPGRGCLTGDTKVFVNNGIKELKDIKIGDFVVGHSGLKREVLDTMSYSVDEDLVEIKSEYGWDNISLTKDHKLLGVKRTITDIYKRTQDVGNPQKRKVKRFESVSASDRSWAIANSYSSNDMLFTPWIKNREIVKFARIDLSKFCKRPIVEVGDETFSYSIPLKNDLSIRAIHRELGISRNCLVGIKNGKKIKWPVKKVRDKLEKYLSVRGLTTDQWVKTPNVGIFQCKRWLDLDTQTTRIIGRWIGDGWITSKKNSGKWGIAYNSADIVGINELVDFVKNLGLSPKTIHHATKKLTQVVVYSGPLSGLFSHLFPNYNYTSNTKYIGDLICLDDELLKHLIIGLSEADGHILVDKKRGIVRENIDTTSKTLAEEIKLALLFLKIPSSVATREPYLHANKSYPCKKSYKIRFKGIRTPKSKTLISNEDGYLCRIISTNKTTNTKVYDITVDVDHSYCTSNYVVHNSAGGSLLCYLMGITHINPFDYDLPFNRFFSLDRIMGMELPDIDVDLEDRTLLVGKDGRSGYLYKRWDNKAAQVSTRTTMRLKSAIRDTNRYFKGKVESAIETLAKSLPSPPQNTNDLDWVLGEMDEDGERSGGLLKQSEKLREYTVNNPEQWKIVSKAMGLTRAYSSHASAFILSDVPIQDVIPTKQGHITQYEAKEVEAAKLIKYDFLVVNQLKDIRVCLDLINKNNGVKKTVGYFDHDGQNAYIWKLPQLPEVFQSIWQGATETIFQIGTHTITPFVIEMQPDKTMDIATLLALGRPGPMDFINPETDRNMVEEYMMLRKGKIEPDIKALADLLPETYGVIVFQEQLNKIARDLAGFTGAEAERVRKHMAKKNMPELKKIEPAFMEGALKKVDLQTATTIWERMVTFGRYGFSVIHAVEYAHITYACMFLKHHYRLEWWTAILTNAKEKEISGKLWPYVKDLLTAPDINLSTDQMEIDYANHKIRAKLGVVRGIGAATIDPVVAGRPYLDIQDFVNRDVAGPSTSRKLIHVGVLDSLFEPNIGLLDKLQLFENALEVKKFSEKVVKPRVDGKPSKVTEVKIGKIPEEYLVIENDPINNASIKKSILPSLLVGLYDLGRCHSKCIIGRNKPSRIMTSPAGVEVLLITGEQTQRLNEMDGDSEDKHVAVAAYIVSVSTFDYKNNTKQALKVMADCDGFVTEFVLWPDYFTKKLEYPKELKKGKICTLFLKKRAEKSDICTITEIVIES